MEQRQTEFTELSQKAQIALEKTASPQLGLMDVLQLWIRPAFANPISWTVFSSNKMSDEMVVRQITWDKGFDTQRFLDPMLGLKYGWHTSPTLIIKDASVEKAQYDELRAKINGVPVPLLGVGGDIGIDGTSYGIRTPFHWWGFHLHWWEDGPSDWQPITKWASQMREFLSDSVGNSNSTDSSKI